jgi:proteasome lid subunit RPN8/RPN11
MIIDLDAYVKMIMHMQEAAPREGVGLLAGPQDRPAPVGGQWQSAAGAICDRWIPLDNVSDFPGLRYEVDPEALIAAWNVLEGDRRRPWVVCHSHTSTSAAPSPLDIRYAVDQSLLHMVVSLAGREPVAVLWRLDPNAAPVDRCRRVRYQLHDLGFQAIPPTDLTHGVTAPTV